MSDILKIIISSLLGGGVCSIVLACLKRKWDKEDKKNDDLSDIKNGLRVIIVDRAKILGQQYIDKGSITIEEKESFDDFYTAGKRLNLNGHLDVTKNAIEKLKIN